MRQTSIPSNQKLLAAVARSSGFGVAIVALATATFVPASGAGAQARPSTPGSSVATVASSTLVTGEPAGQTWSAQVVSTDQLPALRAAATATSVVATTVASTSTTVAATTVPARPRRKPSASVSTVAPVASILAAPESSVAGTGPGDAASWAALRKCESGGRYDLNTGNGYYGAYQFALGTWRKLGFQGVPSDAPASVQDEAARKLQAKLGWGQWPSCSRSIGLR